MDFHSMLSKFKRDAATAAAEENNPTKKPRLSSLDQENSNNNVSAVNDRKRVLSKVPVKTIYLVCPPNVQTGGPEAMHQLCHVVNTHFRDDEDGTNAIQAFMLYVHVEPEVRIIRRKSCRVEAYDIYDAPLVPSHLPTFSPTELFIWPECWTNYMDHLISPNTATADTDYYTDSHHQLAIWWLSVNNNNQKFQQWNKRGDILHLYQSEYAKQHILQNLTSFNHQHNSNSTSNHEQVICLTEYIPNRSTSTNEVEPVNRDLQVLYNPLKGMHFTHEIIKRCGNAIKFTPIGGGMDGRERISPKEVRDLLHRAKVYIDFGPHPGMDRLPREAALANCIVITNMLGAAKYAEDVPIPPEYKVEHVHHVSKLLTSILNDYEEKTKDFDSYREWIHGQENRMIQCVQSFLKIITTNRQTKKD